MDTIPGDDQAHLIRSETKHMQNIYFLAGADATSERTQTRYLEASGVECHVL